MKNKQLYILNTKSNVQKEKNVLQINNVLQISMKARYILVISERIDLSHPYCKHLQDQNWQ